MINLKVKNQAEGTCEMYIKPELEIVVVNDEDIIQTSLWLGGELDLGKLGEFEWF